MVPFTSRNCCRHKQSLKLLDFEVFVDSSMSGVGKRTIHWNSRIRILDNLYVFEAPLSQLTLTTSSLSQIHEESEGGRSAIQKEFIHTRSSNYHPWNCALWLEPNFRASMCPYYALLQSSVWPLTLVTVCVQFCANSCVFVWPFRWAQRARLCNVGQLGSLSWRFWPGLGFVADERRR